MSPPRPAGAGSGVGLSISRAIALAHAGDLVAVCGGRGQGASFTLLLPLGPGLRDALHRFSIVRTECLNDPPAGWTP